MPDASHPPPLMVGQDCPALSLLAVYKDAWTRYTGRLHLARNTPSFVPSLRGISASGR